jgi:hypothetical protein
MRTKADHKNKADHNQEFLKSIDSKRYPDWIVTVGFYKALHVIEMLFATSGKHSDNHRDRHDTLKRTHPDIWREYRPLYTLSRRARYKVNVIADETVKCALGRLAKVEEIVSGALSQKAK